MAAVADDVIDDLSKEVQNLIKLGQFIPKGNTIQVNGTTLAVSLVCYGMYRGFTLAESHLQVAPSLIPSAEQRRFEQLKKLYKTQIGEDAPFPPMWATVAEKPLQLVHPQTKQQIIDTYEHVRLTPYWKNNPQAVRLAEYITSTIITVLDHKLTQNRFFHNNNRDPFVLFAVELLHWANHSLPMYNLESTWAVEQLQKRCNYIDAVLIDQLAIIPGDPNMAEYETIRANACRIKELLEVIIAKANVWRDQTAFIDTLNKFDKSMPEVLMNGISIIWSFLKADKDIGYPDIMQIRKPDRVKRFEQVKHTLLFRQLQAFLEIFQINGDFGITREVEFSHGKYLMREFEQKLLDLNAEYLRYDSPLTYLKIGLNDKFDDPQIIHFRSYAKLL